MLKEALNALRSAQRPVLIYGAGVRLADAKGDARGFAGLTGIPVSPTWGARDMFRADGEDSGLLCVGGFGTHGTRAANFAVQNADWILSVGSRLDSKATGTPREYFARGADIFMVDIDPYEVAKFRGKLGRSFQGVQADAGMFLRDAAALVSGGTWPDFRPWRERCRDWLRRYPVVAPEYRMERAVNPYVLVDRLSEYCRSDDIIVSDTGLSLAWLMQAFRFKHGQRFIHALNQTPMGYGLPAALGAAIACPGRRVVHVAGDGGLMLNIQELSVVAGRKLPIKVLLFNNDGHAMCRQTQEQWLEGRYYSTSVEGGLSFPSFYAVAEAFGVRAHPRLRYAADVDAQLRELLCDDAPALLEAVIGGHHRLVPQVQYGRPNEDGNPPLPREELAAQMTVGMVGAA